jgi:hypothetical protein
MRRRRITLVVLTAMVAIGPLILLAMFPGDATVGEPWQLGAFSTVFGIPAIVAFISLRRLRPERLFSRLHDVSWVWRRAFRGEVHEGVPIGVVQSRAVYICFCDGSRFTISGLKQGLDEAYEALQTLCPQATFGFSAKRERLFARAPRKLMRSSKDD